MEQTTVSDIVAKDFRAAAVFEEHSIDFCCHGKVSLEEACKKSGVTVDNIQSELALISAADKNTDEAYDAWESDKLSDYIIQTHHRYVKEAIPVTTAYCGKVAFKHGARHPEVIQIKELFQELSEELTQHMTKEEIILFPYIKLLASSQREGKPVQKPPFGTIQNPIRMMESEHDNAGNNLEAIRSVANNFTLPPDACATFNVTYQELKRFESDLHKHIHLENNILFPKALELERQLLDSR
ncbi:MAG: iron-sulfur cluster repair di-iron protein [Bacteroidota bacterium]